MTSNSEPRGACETHFLGPTDHRGARVKAVHLNTRRSVTLHWQHEAPTELLYRCSVDGGGWVFVRTETGEL